MGNGGVRDSLRIQMREATTSISPVARLGLTEASPRSATLPFHGDHVFRPHLLGALMHGGIHILVEDHLGDAFTVAQIDENDAAMVAAPVDPAHQEHVLAGVGGAQLAAGVGAAKLAQKIQYDGGWRGRFHSGSLQFEDAASRAAISSRVRVSCSPVDMFLRA